MLYTTSSLRILIDLTIDNDDDEPYNVRLTPSGDSDPVPDCDPLGDLDTPGRFDPFVFPLPRDSRPQRRRFRMALEQSVEYCSCSPVDRYRPVSASRSSPTVDRPGELQLDEY